MLHSLDTTILPLSREGKADLPKLEALVKNLDLRHSMDAVIAVVGQKSRIRSVQVHVRGNGAILRDVVTALDQHGFLG